MIAASAISKWGADIQTEVGTLLQMRQARGEIHRCGRGPSETRVQDLAKLRTIRRRGARACQRAIGACKSTNHASIGELLPINCYRSCASIAEFASILPSDPVMRWPVTWKVVRPRSASAGNRSAKGTADIQRTQRHPRFDRVQTPSARQLRAR